MIITRLIGGLGNQMFQYAVARALSLRLDTSLSLDIKDLDTYKLHQGFELNSVFATDAKIATNSDLSQLLKWQAPRLVKSLMNKRVFSSLRNKNWIAEPGFRYWDGISNLHHKAYLDGYWQSELYFKDYADVIRSDFQFQGALDSDNLLLANNIDSCNSIGLHVRRGDYLSNPSSASVHGVCSLDYYKDAMSYIESIVEKPTYFVFSDDLEWVRKKLQVSDRSIVYVDNNHGKDSYKDMWLMSLCKHNIIANSTFSWWGAWLNSHAGKIIVAPKKWFKDSYMQSHAINIYPESWVKF